MRKITFKIVAVVIAAIGIVACQTEDDGVRDNTGSVVGTWGLSNVSIDVKTNSAYDLMISPLIESGLQTYVSNNFPNAYLFDENYGYAFYYIDSEETTTSQGSGTYSIAGDSLYLVDASTSLSEVFNIYVANDTLLRLNKDLTTSYADWKSIIDALLAGTGYGDYTITKAEATFSYVK